MLNLFAVVVERDFVTIEWASFIAGLASNPILVVVTLLNIGVIVVNGATDAPNAIATVVSTRAMKPKPAIVMAAVCNFLGLLVVSLFGLLFVGNFGMFDIILCGVGLLIFMGFTAYDTQKLRAMYAYYGGDAEMLHKSSIIGALQLYLDYINIFLYVLRLLGRSRRN